MTISVLAVTPVQIFSQTRQHKFRRQAYLQGNTDFISPGSFGIESTFIFENDYNVPDTFYLPNNDITYAVNENLELMAGMNFIYTKSAGIGLQPMDFSVKYNIFDEDEKIPQIDVIGKVQSQGIGSKKLSIGKTLPSFAIYGTKNFSPRFHSVLDFGMQWLDANQPASFAADFFSEYRFAKKYTINLEINEYSTGQKFVNLIVGIGATREISKNFTLEFNCGKYLQKINQNYYFSLGFNQIFEAKKRQATAPATP